MTFDPIHFRRTCGHFATGITVITTRDGDQTHGMTANAFASVSLDPPLVMVSVDNRSHLHRLLPGVGWYGVSVLTENQAALSKYFSGQPVEGLDVTFITRNGVALVEGAMAYFVVQIVDAHPAGDHTLYIGRVEHFESRDGQPLLFFGGKYRHLPQEE
jgi:flavin reductase (DIM6/NTAB) family NADH-FMN oxidoreductase RutF